MKEAIMFRSISNRIDWFITKQGDVTSLLIIPLLVVVLYEVLMRYGFNSPTIWGFEMTTFLYGIHYMFGISYTEVKNGHVRVDIFTSLASKKTQAIVNALTTLFFFMPVMVCMTIWSTKFAWYSIDTLERNSTSWAPPIYPYKMIMALCFFFLLLEGISRLIKDLQIVFGKEEEVS